MTWASMTRMVALQLTHCDTLLPQKHGTIHVTDKRFIPQFRFRLEPYRYNAYSYDAFGPPCRLVRLSDVIDLKGQNGIYGQVLRR